MSETLWIPDSWKLTTLGEITTITRLAGAEYSDYWAVDPLGEIIALRGFNIGENRLILNDCEHISAILSSKLIRSKLFEGDIVFPCVGSIGKAAVIKENDKYHINQNIAKITPHEADSDFLVHYFLSPLAQEQILTFNTSSSQPSVLVGNLRKFIVHLPPLDEQRKIAAILNTWDEAITLTEALIDALQRRKQALMQLLLTGTVRFAEFAGDEWRTDEFIKFLKLHRGYDLSVGERQSGIYKVIASNGTVGYHNEGVIKGPGVITGRSGTIGKVIYEEDDFWPLNTTLFISDFNGNDALFAYYFLQYFKLERFGSGTGVPTLNRNYVHPVEIAYPDIDEQQKIAEFLKLCDEELKLYTDFIERLKTQKRGLMQQLLTGALRVQV